MPQKESFFMKEIGIESKRSKRARVMVERSNKVLTIRLTLHMVQGVGDIAMRVGGRRSMRGERRWGEVRVEGCSRMVAMRVVVALCVTWHN